MTPQRKNALMILALLGVASALGLYAYFGVMKKEEKEAAKKEEAEKLFVAPSRGEKYPDGGAPEVVFNLITVKAKGGTTTIEKRGSNWMITFPLSAKADSFAVEQIIHQLRTSKFKSTVEDNPTEADLAKYGFKEPKFTVSAKGYLPDAKGLGEEDPQRRVEVVIYGGMENTFDGSVYLRREGGKAVYSAEGSVRASLEKDTFELRDKEVLSFEEASLRRIEVKAGKHSYVLGREDANEWHLLAPIAERADAQAISSAISSLRSERAVSFPEDSPERRKGLGLNAPALDAKFSLASGDTVRVRLGALTADAGSNLAMLREQGASSILAEVSSSALSTLDKDPLEWRDKSILTVKRDEISELVLAPGGSQPKVVLKKLPADSGTGDDWQVLSPEKGAAKQWKISSALWGLTSLKASAIGEDNPKDWSKYGITPASRAVTAMDSAGKVIGQLQVGKAVSGKPSTIYLRGSANHAFEIESSKLDDLPFKVEDILDQPAKAGAADAGPH